MDIINPFAQSIVTDAWQAPQSDVPMIHAGVFELCCEVLEQVRRSGGSRSVLLHGLPGSGKTHLLARVRTHLNGAPNDMAATVPVPLPPNVLFIAVRLRAGARMLCRHRTSLRHCEDPRPPRLARPGTAPIPGQGLQPIPTGLSSRGSPTPSGSAPEPTASLGLRPPET